MGKDFYICACSEKPEGGIYRYRLNEAGVPELLSFAKIAESNYLCAAPDGKTIYSTHCEEGKPGAAAFRVLSDGSLEFLNRMESLGEAPCHVITSANGKFLYCANYMSGNLAEFRIAPDGAIAERTQLVRHSGKGPNAKRQEGPHVHFVNWTPDGKYLVAVDLGIDALKLYPFDAEKGIAPEKVRTFRVEPAGSGPRHFVFNRAGNLAYLINELGNTVMVLAYSEGAFELKQTLSTIPADFTGFTKASAIRLSPDERFLYASNRGYDSTACFRILPDGLLERLEIVMSGGTSPRDIAFLPGGRVFGAANEFSDSVIFFDFEPETGHLTPNGQTLTLPRPLAFFHL